MDTGFGADEGYTLYDVFMVGSAYYGPEVIWYPVIYSSAYYGEFSWEDDHVIADLTMTWSGSYMDSTLYDWCGSYYEPYYDVVIEDEGEDEDDVDTPGGWDTGGWTYYYGADPVEGDQILTGTLACGEEVGMPYADVYTTSILDEGETLTATVDGSVDEISLWINSSDSCVASSASWAMEGCPGEAEWCYTASADIEGADPYEVVVQRYCYMEVETPAEYTLRLDKASHECESSSCPEPEIVTLTSDDIEAAVLTEYSSTSGWRIEGDLSWE